MTGKFAYNKWKFFENCLCNGVKITAVNILLTQNAILKCVRIALNHVQDGIIFTAKIFTRFFSCTPRALPNCSSECWFRCCRLMERLFSDADDFILPPLFISIEGEFSHICFECVFINCESWASAACSFVKEVFCIWDASTFTVWSAVRWTWANGWKGNARGTIPSNWRPESLNEFIFSKKLNILLKSMGICPKPAISFCCNPNWNKFPVGSDAILAALAISFASFEEDVGAFTPIVVPFGGALPGVDEGLDVAVFMPVINVKF